MKPLVFADWTTTPAGRESGNFAELGGQFAHHGARQHVGGGARQIAREPADALGVDLQRPIAVVHAACWADFRIVKSQISGR